MRPFPYRGSDGSLASQPARGHVRPRKVLAAGAVIAAVAAMGTLAAGGSARAALAPGTPLKTLAAAQGNRYFGSAIGQGLLSNSTVTQLQTQQFNMVTPANEMKWDTTEPGNGQFNFAPGDAMVSYATANNERVRCSNLVWHSQLPAWVAQGILASQVQAVMERHIMTEASHFKGKCYAWDVVNEPLNADGTPRVDTFFNAMGIGYIADALKTARAADPGAKLYLNDFDIEGMNAKSNALLALAQSLLSQGVPLDGIGFESHFIVGQVPADMQANMQRFADLGLDVAVTELDDRMTVPASAANLQQQATDFASAVKACLGVTRCVGISASAVGDADSTIPEIYVGQGAATMFDANYNPKPAFFAVQTALGGSGTSILSITNPGPQHGTVGVPFSVTLTASDSNPAATITWSLTGLPAWLTGASPSPSGTSFTLSGTPTVAGTVSVTATARDTAGASASVSFTIAIAPAQTTSCHVTYTPNNYPGGFTANITLANTGTTAINGWTLAFTFPGDQKITSTWNGSTTQSGQNVSITNLSYNATIAAGATTQFGFQGTWTSNNTSPASFTVNGTTCT
jgi:endo-1,4-beta-xylanase